MVNQRAESKKINFVILPFARKVGIICFLVFHAVLIQGQQQPANTSGKVDKSIKSGNAVAPKDKDVLFEEKLVELTLKGPRYESAGHTIKAGKYQVSVVKNSWFNLLTFSFNYNDQTFAKSSQQSTYVYPKFFFGISIPIGVFFTKGPEIKAAKENVKIGMNNQEELARMLRQEVLTKYKGYKTYGALLLVQTQLTEDMHAVFLQVEKKFNDGSSNIDAYSNAAKNYNMELAKQLNLQLQQDIAKLDVERSIGVKLETVTY